jgi:hypothetical protein
MAGFLACGSPPVSAFPTLRPVAFLKQANRLQLRGQPRRSTVFPIIFVAEAPSALMVAQFTPVGKKL